MIKRKIPTVLLGLAVISTAVPAKEYTIGEVVGGIGSFLGGITNSGNSASNTPSGVLVKDLPDLPKLSEKQFLRGISKLDYAEIPLQVGSKNYKLTGSNSRGEWAIWLFSRSSNQTLAQTLQADAKSKKLFDRINVAEEYSSPLATFNGLFDLSKVNEKTRADPLRMYTYSFSTHFKIPDEFVNKKGQVLIDTIDPTIYFVTSRENHMSSSASSEVCYQMINNDFTKDIKGVYTLKKGNMIDYKITCYFGAELPTGQRQTNALQILSMNQENLPKNFKVYSVPDPLAKDAGKSYTLTNRDMFLYENEVYPGK